MINTALVSGVLIVLTFLTGVVIARLLGPEARGHYGAILFWIQFGTGFLSFSLFDAVILRIRHRAEAPESAVAFVVLLSLSLSTFIACVALVLHEMDQLTIEGLSAGLPILLMIAIAVIDLVNRGFISIESAGLSFGRVNTDRVLSPFLFLVGALTLWQFDAVSVNAVLCAFAVSKLPILMVRAYRHRSRLIGSLDFGFVREVASLGPRLHVASSLIMLATSVDRLIVVPVWPPDWIGYYFVAYATTGAGLALASQAIKVTLLPSLAGLPIAEQREKVERLFRLSLVVGLSVAIPVWVLSPFIVPLVYGSAYAPAVGFVQGLMFTTMLQPVMSIVNITNRSFARGRPEIEVALAMLAITGVGFWLTGFERPVDLFVTLAISHVAAIFVGLRHLVSVGVASFSKNLVPGFADVRYVVMAIAEHALKLLAKLLRALKKQVGRA